MVTSNHTYICIIYTCTFLYIIKRVYVSASVCLNVCYNISAIRLRHGKNWFNKCESMYMYYKRDLFLFMCPSIHCLSLLDLESKNIASKVGINKEECNNFDMGFNKTVISKKSIWDRFIFSTCMHVWCADNPYRYQ